MFLVPYRRRLLVAHSSADQVMQRLGKYVASRAFVGTIAPDSFTLRYTCSWLLHGTYQPWIRGRVRSCGSVSELELTYTLHPIGVAVMAFLCVMALRDLALHHNWTGLLFLAAVHCVLYIALFLPKVREIDSVFQCVVE